MSKADEANSSKTNEELFLIEELRVKHNIYFSVFAGLKAYKNWSTGKMVTEEEFKEAAKEYLNSPINKVVDK
jgi:hypothetical protein